MSLPPGAKGDYAAEMAAWLHGPDAVVHDRSGRMKKLGSADIPNDLRNANIQWLHFPVDDFQAAPVIVMSCGSQFHKHCTEF